MKKSDRKIELTEKDTKALRLSLSEMEEKCEELNTSIKVIYMWLERMGLKFKKKFRVVKIDEFRD